MKHCFVCFGEIPDFSCICPYCGKKTTPQITSPEISLIPGTVLNERYCIGENITFGGCGIVYEALDLQGDEKVIIKGIRTGSDAGDGEFRKKRFETEIRLNAEVDKYPYFCKILNAFEENGSLYFVAEKLNGMTLADYINKFGRASEARFCSLAKSIGKALVLLHLHNIVHRDISPDNIWIESEKDDFSEGIQFRLIDFGSAVKTGTADASGIRVHKKGFSAPEEYSKSEAGIQNDIFSFGATLYSFLCGAVPSEVLCFPSVYSDGRKIQSKIRKAIEKSMSPNVSERFDDIETMLSKMGLWEKSKIKVPDLSYPGKEKYNPNALKKGNWLNNRYEIIRLSDTAEDALIYQAFDGRLGRFVSVREFYPSDICFRNSDGSVEPMERYRVGFIERFLKFEKAADGFRSESRESDPTKPIEIFNENNSIYYVSVLYGEKNE